MQLSIYNITVPLFIKTLSNMSPILDKAVLYAEEKKFDVSYLLQARLFPDQFPFVRQIQIVSDIAKGAAARLAGIEPPKMEDNETTVEDLKKRIERTIDFLKTLRPEDICPESISRALNFLRRWRSPIFTSILPQPIQFSVTMA